MRASTGACTRYHELAPLASSSSLAFFVSVDVKKKAKSSYLQCRQNGAVAIAPHSLPGKLESLRPRHRCCIHRIHQILGMSVIIGIQRPHECSAQSAVPV
jgi:hypothetical protein